MLCAKGAQALQVKSVNVEDAVNELINMLCVTEDEDAEDDAEDADDYADEEFEQEKADSESKYMPQSMI